MLMCKHKDVAAANPAGVLAGGIGDRQVRNCGTIGGSVANNDQRHVTGGGTGAWRHHHTNKRDIAQMIFLSGCLKPRLTKMKSSPQSACPTRKISLYQISQPGITLCHGRGVCC